MKFLDISGFTYFYDRLKEKLNAKADASDVSSSISSIQSSLASKADASGVNESISSIRSSISSEVSRAVSAEDALSARMDTFTKLPSGSTAGDAELIDIRVGLNGRSYSSAGTAVRTHASNAANAITKILKEYGSYNSVVLAGVYNVNTKKIDTPLSSTRHIEVSVDPGTIAVAMGYIYNSTYPLWVLLDSNNNLVDYSRISATSSVAEELIVVPQNAVKLIVNCSTNNTEYQNAILSTNIINEGKLKEYLAPIEFAADNVGEIENGVYNVTTGNIDTALSSAKHIQFTVEPKQICFVAGYQYGPSFPLWIMFDSNNNKVKTFMGPGSSIIAKDSFVVPDGVSKIIVNCSTNASENYFRIWKTVASNTFVNSWHGKKMVWLGTSIPAGAKYGKNNLKSYPVIVGNKIGANVINEAVGESSVHCKTLQRIDATYNPYGFVDNWEKCARCLTNTVAEMNWLINNYNIKDSNNNYIFTVNRPSSLTDSDKEFYRSCSYEIKIKDHLDEGDVDVWVFDHGHNDNAYDNNIEDGKTLSDSEVAYKYGINNLYTWEGACNFIFTYILNRNNTAKIIMIGEYDNRLSEIGPHQEIVAKSWEFPFYKQWEVIGWNVNHKITTTGYWDSNGYWQNSGGPEQQITIHDRFVRDHIHPSSDASGYATRHIAALMAKWFINNAPVVDN